MKNTTFFILLFSILSIYGKGQNNGKILNTPEINLFGRENFDTLQVNRINPQELRQYTCDSLISQKREYNNWINYAKSNFYFDDQGKIMGAINSIWVDSTDKWINDYKHDYIYNDAGKLIKFYVYKWHEKSRLWLYYYRNEYFYNSFGNLQTVFEYELYKKNGSIYRKSEYDYNSMGFLTQVIILRRFVNSDPWVYFSKVRYFYDENSNLKTQVGYSWNNLINRWSYSSKTDYANNQLNTLQSKTDFLWDNNLLTYNPYQQYIFKHLSSTQMEEMLYCWNIGTGSYIPRRKIEYFYNNDFSVRNQIYYNWGEIEQQWVPNTRFLFYYPSSINIEESSFKFSIYPNPVIDFLDIKLNGESKQVLFEVYNLQGKKLISQFLLQNEIISVRQLDLGIYLYKLATDKEIYFGKFVKE